jgi:hypothetical protein
MLYTALAASSAALGAVALLAPGTLLGMDAATNVMEATFARVAGTTMILSAAVELVLKGAAEAGRLGSLTYQRLQMASVIKAAVYVSLFAINSQLWAPSTTLALPAFAAASLAINMMVGKVSRGLPDSGAVSGTSRCSPAPALCLRLPPAQQSSSSATTGECHALSTRRAPAPHCALPPSDHHHAAPLPAGRHRLLPYARL